MSENDLLLLDAGGTFEPGGSYGKVTGDVSLKMMNHMKYDAMNLGRSDLAYGLDYLEEKGEDMTFPFLSTNLAVTGDLPFLKSVVIKEVGSSRVAILGAMPVNDPVKTRRGSETKRDAGAGSEGSALMNPVVDPSKIGNDAGSKPPFQTLPPVTTLQEKISSLKRSSDFIVVLSQLPQDQLDALLDDVQGIDLVISCEYPGKTVLTPGRTPTVRVKKGGLELGYVKIEKDQEGFSKIVEERKIILNEWESEENAELLNEFHLASMREDDLRTQRKIEEEVRENLKLSPMEYMQQLQKSGN
jgi:2',3'-cyclic-nucleotide 2'-phosphodiesterase (5'-nucleotidase family)